MVRIAAVLVLLAAAVAHAAPAKPWLYLPGKPTPETIAFAKRQTAARYVIRQSPDVVYVVAYVRTGHPQGFDVDTALDRAAGTTIATVGAKALGPTRKLTVENANAREAIAKLATGATVTLRFVFADDIMYVVYLGASSAFDGSGALRVATRDDGNVYGGLLGDEVRDGRTIPAENRAPTPRTKPSFGLPTTSGGNLDPVVIRRYVKRNIDKLASCYERELTTKPKLAGTVKAEFVIAASGLVSSAKASGVDPKVSDCIADVLEHIQFPKPHDDKDVSATYLLTFRPPTK